MEKIFEQKLQQKFVKLIALNFQEEPIEVIEGMATSGSINLDGKSSVRRTCSLSLITNQLDINSYYWGFKNKFKLEIGLKDFNEEIYWFPQGTYIITSFNQNYSTNNYTISISGKDKMCMLNGDLGGNLACSVDFGTEEYVDLEKNTTTYIDIPIERIIRESVHTYANEPYQNIIINDLDEAALELLEYRGKTPLYLIYNVAQGVYINYTLNGLMQCEVLKDDGTRQIATLETIEQYGRYDPRTEVAYEIQQQGSIIYFSNNEQEYMVARVEYGQTVGYRYTDLIYAGKLIGNIGDTITSIYDKIIKMLGNYEYFYDLDGRFVFQRKKTYVSTVWNNLVDVGNEEYAENIAYTSPVIYNFVNHEMFTSFANNPNLQNLRNDFSIWGKRKGVGDAQIPIHYRYAIDIKPEQYNPIVVLEEDIKDYNTKYPESPMKIQLPRERPYTTEEYDWREIIYQMSLDFYKYNQLDNFNAKVAEANPDLYPTGRTGYEQYYIDLQGFWRQIYNPNPKEEEKENFIQDENHKYWTKNIITSPTSLNFWFDFLDAESELGYFSTRSVGDRIKVIDDDKVNSIYFKTVPDLIFTTQEEYNNNENVKNYSAYIPVFIQGQMQNLFSISTQGKSAKDELDNALYNYSYCIENITISSIPVYILQPNCRINIKDKESKVDGDYIIERITFPLTYNGTMSINASKVPQRIF